MRLFVLLLSLFSCSLCAQEEVMRLTAETEGLATIDGCVNAISGDYFEAHQDIHLNCLEPLSLSRYYDSGHQFRSEFGLGFGLSFPMGFVMYTRSGISSINLEDRQGMITKFDGTSHKSGAQAKVRPALFDLGYTNYHPTEISARTNIRNTKIIYEGKRRSFKGVGRVYLGSGIVREYEFWQGSRNITYADLAREIRPNGNRLLFDYDARTRRLKRVRATNSLENKILGEIVLEYQKNQCIIRASNGQWCRLHTGENQSRFEKSRSKWKHHVLKSSESSHNPSIKYEFPTYAKVGSYLQHKRITYPMGLVKELGYYSDGRVSFIKEKTKNKERYALRINYRPNETEAIDALGNQRVYSFDHSNRVTKIAYQERGRTLYSRNFFWQKGGNLQAIALKDHRDIAYTVKRLHYDAFGNVLREDLFGNITGENVFSFSLNKDAYPQAKADLHQTHYKYSKNHLKVEERLQDGRVIRYSYYPDTQLLKSQLTEVDGQIVHRLFFRYNDIAAPIEKIEDDGSSKDSTSMQNVSWRLLQQIKPVEKGVAIGQPEKITHFYYQDGEYLRKTSEQYIYDYRGLLTRIEYYDSNNNILYKIHKAYDERRRLIKESDPLGVFTEYSYDVCNRKIKEKRENLEKRYFYNLQGKCVKEELFDLVTKESVVKTSAYDDCARKTLEVDRYGNQTRYQHDALGNITQMIMPDQGVVHRQYNALGYLVKETDQKGFTREVVPNIYGKPLIISHPDGSKERFTYDLCNRLIYHLRQDQTYLTFKYNAFGKCTEKNLFDQNHQLIQQEKFFYKGDLLQRQQDALGRVHYYFYDGAKRLIRKEFEGRFVEFQYDDLDRCIEEKRPYSQGSLQRVVYAFDHLNRKTKEELYDQNTLMRQTLFSYDSWNRLTECRKLVDEQKYSIEKRTYNVFGELIFLEDACNHVSTFQYNHRFKNGSKYLLEKTTIDPKGHITREQVDFRGNILQVERLDTQLNLVAKEYFLYNKKAERVKAIHERLEKGVLKENFVQAFVYDALGRITQEIIQPNTASERVTTISYDSMGRVREKHKPSNIRFFYRYNAQGLMVEEKSSDGSIHFCYLYNALGQLIESVNQHDKTKTERLYNSFSEIVEERLANGLTLFFDYDFLGRLKKCVLPHGKVIDYEYDAAHLTCVTYNNLDHYYLKHDHTGELLEASLMNGMEQKKRYDLLSRVEEIAYDQILATKKITYDSIGNITSLKVVEQEKESIHTFDYDSLNQLTSEKGYEQHHYLYDSLFNRIEEDGKRNQIDPLMQLNQSIHNKYQYDSDGRRILDEDFSYRYNAKGELVEVVKEKAFKIRYFYDAHGRRLSKRVSYWNSFLGSFNPERYYRFIYQGQFEIGSFVNEETSEPFELRILGAAKHAEVGSAVLIVLDGSCYVPAYDHRGNIIALFDLDKNLCQSYHYGAFGTCDVEGSLTSFFFFQRENPWRFVSKRTDFDTGFTFFGKREYDPKEGRFINPDPIGFLDGINLYAYVANNPLAHFDPFGLSREDHPAYKQNTGLIGKFKEVFSSMGRRLENYGDSISSKGFFKYSFMGAGRTLQGKSFFTHDLQPTFGYVGSKRLTGKDIIIVQGINTTKEEAIEAARIESERLNGVVVHYMVNPTKGYFYDLVYAGLSKFGVQTSASLSLYDLIKSNLDKAKDAEDYTLFTICHSRGAAEFYAASLMLSKNDKSQIAPLTLGGAKIIKSEEFKTLSNIVHPLDIVSRFNLDVFVMFFSINQGNFGNNTSPSISLTNSEIQSSNVGGRTYNSAHSYYSPHYQKALKLHSKMILESY